MFNPVARMIDPNGITQQQRLGAQLNTMRQNYDPGFNQSPSMSPEVMQHLQNLMAALHMQQLQGQVAGAKMNPGMGLVGPQPHNTMPVPVRGVGGQPHPMVAPYPAGQQPNPGMQAWGAVGRAYSPWGLNGLVQPTGNQSTGMLKQPRQAVPYGQPFNPYR